MTELSPYIEAAEASALWRSAKLWLVRWASAGFVPTERDGKFFMPAGWAVKFPDGPGLVDALRTEMTALIRDGNNAVLSDPRLTVAYPQYLANSIDTEETRLRHAEWCVRKSKEELAKLRADLAASKAPLTRPDKI